jgi:lysozyme
MPREPSKELIDSVKLHEGFRTKAYLDTVGVWTIGYGTNLQVLSIDEALAARWLAEKLAEARTQAERMPEWASLDGPRQDVVVEMIYNLGVSGFMGFANTRVAMRDGRWEDAARGMLASKWATQVGRRAKRLAEQMRTGKYWMESE